MFLKDSSGKRSITMSAFVVGFLVVNAKLLLSGVTIAGFTMTPFTGSEYSMAVAALGGVYIMRRNKQEGEDK